MGNFSSFQTTVRVIFYTVSFLDQTNRGWIYIVVGKGLLLQVSGFSMPSIK